MADTRERLPDWFSESFDVARMRQMIAILERRLAGINQEIDQLIASIPDLSGSLADGDYGDISITGGQWIIDPGAVSYGKIQDVSDSPRVLGRISGGSGDVEELTGSNVNSMLPVFTAVSQGVVPASGGDNEEFLNASGQWVHPSSWMEWASV